MFDAETEAHLREDVAWIVAKIETREMAIEEKLEAGTQKTQKKRTYTQTRKIAFGAHLCINTYEDPQISI